MVMLVVQETDTADVWQMLRLATGDALFVSFLQTLLVHDPTQRSNDDAIMQHDFLHSCAKKCAQDAAGGLLKSSVSTLSKLPDMDRLQTVPDMPHVLCDAEQIVCATATGTIFRCVIVWRASVMHQQAKCAS